ncbi:MAG: hypothetical protein A4E35_01955 [Methanoregula sp. PtaU1.Bin051]|nr:MAG: hypothetical protein A4E35_01955 [Methanoregula sp. PtaU1.Bin051]
MKDSSELKEVTGTRAGNAILFTCPDCQKDNSIVYNMPKEFFRDTRKASCSSCRKRFTILTPDGSPVKQRVYAQPRVR